MVFKARGRVSPLSSLLMPPSFFLSASPTRHSPYIHRGHPRARYGPASTTTPPDSTDGQGGAFSIRLVSIVYACRITSFPRFQILPPSSPPYSLLGWVTEGRPPSLLPSFPPPCCCREAHAGVIHHAMCLLRCSCRHFTMNNTTSLV